MSANAAVSILLLVVVVATVAWVCLYLVRHLPGEVQMPAKVLIVVVAIVILIWRLMPLLP